MKLTTPRAFFAESEAANVLLSLGLHGSCSTLIDVKTRIGKARNVIARWESGTARCVIKRFSNSTPRAFPTMQKHAIAEISLAFAHAEGRRVAQWVERRTFGSRGRGFESARGKICSALFFGAPVFEITLVVEKDVKP